MTAVPDEPFADIVEMLVNNSTFSVVFNGLEEFVVYQFTISARTEVGFGPTSPEVLARTDEAGNEYIYLLHLHVHMHVHLHGLCGA